jgi:hypothetical protein
MVRGRLYPKYRRGGRFFGRRVNCEGIPLLPVRVVARMFDDPRKIPYLLVWRSERDGEVKEAVRISAHIDPFLPFPPDWTDVLEIKRPDGGAISFPRFCALCRETAARLGSSFVPIAACHDARSTGGNLGDSTPAAFLDRSGGADAAPGCAMRPKGAPSCFAVADICSDCWKCIAVDRALNVRRLGFPKCSPRLTSGAVRSR